MPHGERALLEELRRAVSAVKTPILLFLDLDGTLAPLRKDPSKVRISKNVLRILRSLSKNPRVKIFIVSGRDEKFLRSRIPFPNVSLAAEHGAVPLAKNEKRIFSSALRALSALSEKYPGTFIERKSSAIAFHCRNAPPRLQFPIRKDVLCLLSGFSGKGILIIHGKKVVEFVFSKAGKGAFLKRTASTSGSSIIIAIGDDETDEGMFREANRLGGISVLVGKNGKSSAGYSIPSVRDAALFLKSLLLAIEKSERKRFYNIAH